MDSQIVLFLTGKGVDYRLRKLIQLRGLADTKLEKSFDVIQWMFPTDIPSEYSSFAPVLNNRDIKRIIEDNGIQWNLAMSLERMIKFYEKDEFWIYKNSHHFRRFTRILRCLWLADRKHDYVCLSKVLDELYKIYNHIIGDETYKLWKNANNYDYLINYTPSLLSSTDDNKEESVVKEESVIYDVKSFRTTETEENKNFSAVGVSGGNYVEYMGE